jgi:hypothetical protein
MTGFILGLLTGLAIGAVAIIFLVRWLNKAVGPRF